VDNVEQLHDSSTVVGDGLLAILVDEQEITSVGAKSRLDGVLYGETSVDVGDDLATALRLVGAWVEVVSCWLRSE
jgi:hypothetical protein